MNNDIYSVKYKIFLFHNGFGYYIKTILDDQTKSLEQLTKEENQIISNIDQELDDKLIFQSNWLTFQ